MKKKSIAAILLVSALMLSVACDTTEENPTGNETDTKTETTAPETSVSGNTGDNSTTDDGYNYMGNDLSAFITVGNYKGITATAESSVLTDAEYDEYIALLLEEMSYNEQITDRPVEAGETVITSYSGYLDGVQFQNGTAEGQEVTAADGTGMIDGFGPAFVGQMPGVEFSFKVTFPTIYGNLDLAGKEVTFVCTIDYIMGENVITPSLTDSFVREEFGYETVETFETALREALAQQKAEEAEQLLTQTLWAEVFDASELKAYPDGELDRHYEMLMANAEATAAMYSVTLEEYISLVYQDQVTFAQFEEAMMEQAKQYVKDNLIIYQIAKVEGIVVTEDEFNTYVEEIAEMSGTTSDVLLEYYGRETVMLSCIQERVAAIIEEHAIITPAEETDTAA